MRNNTVWTNRPGADVCHHLTWRITETAGMRKAACETCGHVTFRYLHNVFAEQIAQLKLEPIRK